MNNLPSPGRRKLGYEPNHEGILTIVAVKTSFSGIRNDRWELLNDGGQLPSCESFNFEWFRPPDDGQECMEDHDVFTLKRWYFQNNRRQRGKWVTGRVVALSGRLFNWNTGFSINDIPYKKIVVKFKSLSAVHTVMDFFVSWRSISKILFSFVSSFFYS